MLKLILVRHGESEWNKLNLFTGWTDVDLSEKGVEEAKGAGKKMKEAGMKPTLVFTSVLTRAIKTANLALEEMGMLWLPVERSWRLNERHYGALQGLNKAETAEKYGDEQVHIWRRSYDVPPIALEVNDPRHPKFDERYAKLDPKDLPATESLKITLERVLPYWNEKIAPALTNGEVVLVAAHGNSLRAIVKHLEKISDDEIPNLEIPTGTPRVYELNDDFTVFKVYYL